jgi:F0F1-type ATP synthase assembly protein I
MRAIRNLVIALCAPIVLISQGYFLQDFFYTMPWWLSVIVLAAHVIALLGFASLVDTRRQQWPR